MKGALTVESAHPLFTIAIQPDAVKTRRGGRQSFSARWIERLDDAGHRAVPVDVLVPGFLERLGEFDGFMWAFPPTPFPRDIAKRVMAAIEHAADLPVFPDRATCWHFDDKVAQSYLLEGAGIPTPRTWVFWRYAAAQEFCRTARYPLVIKLGAGCYSENVALVRNQREAEEWTRQLFTTGLTDLSRRGLSGAGALMRAARSGARALLGRPEIERHRGYVLLQELVPGNDFDTRVTVIGNRAFAFRRHNRPDDFRASGSGLVDHDPAQVDRGAVALAFRVARLFGTQVVCVDVLRRGEELVITEISYYFETWGIAECPGHWRAGRDDGNFAWIEGPIRPEDAILDDFLDRVAGRSGARAGATV